MELLNQLLCETTRADEEAYEDLAFFTNPRFVQFARAFNQLPEDCSFDDICDAAESVGLAGKEFLDELLQSEMILPMADGGFKRLHRDIGTFGFEDGGIAELVEV